MTVQVKYRGGPRNGTKGNLRNHDQPPCVIAVPSTEATGKGYKPGRYKLGTTWIDHAEYQWAEGV